MTRQAYLALCMQQSSQWLRKCAAHPSPYMRPRHVALILIALRRMRHA